MEFFGLDLRTALVQIGHIGILAIIFAESGILAGFFLPGDSLLFTAGFLASAGLLNLWVLLIGGSIAAILGDSFGYYLGNRYGERVFSRQDSGLFHRDHIERAKTYFARYGPITLVLARFIPFIRTFVPVLAGVGKMRYSTFLTYNVFGGIFWVSSMTLLGYFLGELIPDIDRYVLPIVAAIVILSLMPGLIALVRNRRSKNSP